MDTIKTLIKWNPFGQGYFSNPYPHLAECRRNNPIQKIAQDSYLFFRYDHVRSFLREKDFKVQSLTGYFDEKKDYLFKNAANACPYLSKASELWPMFLNDELHRRIRTAITKALYVVPIEPFVEKAVKELNIIFKDKDAFDLVDYCGMFTYLLFGEILGIDNEKGYEKLKQFTNLVARTPDRFVPKKIFLAINDEIISHKGIFKNSIFKDIILEETKDLKLDEDQIYSIMLVSFVASFETTRDNMTLGLIEILNKKELIDYTLSMDKKGRKLLCEEIFRYSTPAQYTIRINTKPLYCENQLIAENSKLYLCLASANRDEEVFDRPEEFIPNRVHNPHIAFGSGIHFCLGAAITRSEMGICLKPMVNFLKAYTVKDIKIARQVFMRTPRNVVVQRKASNA